MTITKIAAQVTALRANSEMMSFLIAGSPVYLSLIRPEKAATACHYAGFIGSLSLISGEPAYLARATLDGNTMPQG
ncbi:MAG: hypothetical protein ACR2GC_11920 [Methyloceanibacter sp.]|uniref:hypothetical protein n=1 Tax=Methyloceanibacter sp. TaxID=1965321 RepID=UPI003D9AD9A3